MTTKGLKMGFAERVEAGIRSGVVNGRRTRTAGGRTDRTFEYKIAETEARYVRGYVEVETATGKVFSKATKDLIGRIEKIGPKRYAVTHAATSEVAYSATSNTALSELAKIQNSYVDAKRA